MRNMLPFNYSPQDIARQLGQRAKALRIQRQLTQSALAERIGVSVKTLAKFENQGDADMQTVIKTAVALSVSSDLEQVFVKPDIDQSKSLDELIAAESKSPRKRAYAPRAPRAKRNGNS